MLEWVMTVPLSNHAAQYSAKKYDFCSFCSFYHCYCFLFITFIFSYHAVHLYSSFCLHALFHFRKLFQKIFSRTIHLASFIGIFLARTFGKPEFCCDLRTVAWNFLISFLIHTDRYFLERLLITAFRKFMAFFVSFVGLY